MSSRLTNEDYMLKVLNEFEDELVHELSQADPINLCKDLFRTCIITSDMNGHFTSLDHSRVGHNLQIRYLLRLVSVMIKSDIIVWGKFLDTLGRISSKTLMVKLKKAGSNINNKLTEISEVENGSNSAGSGDASMEENVSLNHGDIGLLTELLVPISHKWELLSIRLGFQEQDIENFRKQNNKISLNKSIACWISRDSNSTLKKLTQALSSELVMEARVALDLEKKFKEARIQCEKSKKHEYFKTENYSSYRDTNFTLTISNMSYHTEVADGKSTLLLVQASPRESVSYQWKKDGQPLVDSSTYSGVHDDILVVSHARQGTEGEYTCCVSKEGKEVCSNKITLTVLYHPAKKRLLNLYNAKREIPEDSWPPVVSAVFINLALIKSGIDCTDVYDFSVCGDADDIIAKKETVEYEEVFTEYQSRELILLEGRPGSGKTTLVHKIIKDWAKGKVLIKAKLVFLVTLRVLNTDGKDETLSDLLGLFYSNTEELKTIGSEIDKNDGEGFCFVIDGLDEYQPLNIKKSVIYKILDKTYLPQAMIIVSSRPAATFNVKRECLTIQIEVFGFSKQQIFEYIDNFPFGTVSSSSASTNIVAAKLKDYLVSNPNVFDMCYLPVHAAMICFLYKCDKQNISCMQTKIYEQFTRLIICRHLTRCKIEIEISSLKKLSGFYKKYFDNLCHLAYTMTINSKQAIAQNELHFQLSQNGSHGDECSLGLVTVYNTVHDTGLHHSYSFLHLTLQEFLAAYYIASLNRILQIMLIYDLSYTMKHKFTVWTFYFGLINFESEWFGWFGSKRLKQLLQYACLLNVQVHYAFESQQQLVCDEVVKQRNGALCFFKIHTPTDIQAIEYLITTTSQPITKLVLKYYHYDEDDYITILLERLTRKDLCKLETLEFSFKLSDNKVNILFNILKLATNLNKLVIKLKDIDCDSAKCFIDHLKHLTSLKYLKLSCSSPPPSIKELVCGLQCLTKTEFHLSFEDVDTESALALVSGLQLCNIFYPLELHLINTMSGHKYRFGSLPFLILCDKPDLLHLLSVSHNNIGCELFNILSNGLLHCTSLYILNLSYNDISAGGTKCLASLLQCHKGLVLLDLSHNNFKMSHLVQGLQCLTDLEHLDLSHNNIGSDGAASLACALRYLTKLSFLYLSHNNIGSDGAASLACELRFLTKLSHLHLLHNNISSDGAASLACALRYLTKLSGLSLSHNNIGSDGMIALARGLSCLTKLIYLHVSRNNIDFEGTKAIITSLKGCYYLVQAIINIEDEHCSDGIIVRDLISPDNTRAIAELKAAAECKNRMTKLDLGFKLIEIPSQRQC